MRLDLQSLIEKLNPVSRKGLETAAEYCVSQTNYNVEVEHLLLKLLELPDTDIQCLLHYYDIHAAEINRELTARIDSFKRGNSRTPTLSPHIIELLEQAWLYSSLRFKSARTRSGGILLALLSEDILRGVAYESAPSLQDIPLDALKRDIAEIITTSGEAQENEGAAEAPPAPPPKTAAAKQAATATPALDQFTIDLTARAKAGEIDPILGRDPEIRQIIDILSRRRQNNPILTGEAGVGKTAVVEGFAIRIAQKAIPPALANLSLRLLDLGLLQAGAGIKGEFEKRLKAVIEEVKRAPRPIILFIDEAHTIIGAGGPAGGGDAANLLKPALARGELRTIAATTWTEYKKYFEKDPALARRFQVVKIEEPDEAAAVEMLRGVVAHLEKHHGVTVLDEAVWDAVRLSQRYISGRKLPDKAISVLDTACARVGVGQNSTPPEIEDALRRIEQLELETTILKRENASGIDHQERISDLTVQLEETTAAKATLELRWEQELAAVESILALQEKIHTSNGQAEAPSIDESLQSKQKLVAEKQALTELQQDRPLVPVCVDSQVVAAVISAWTGIPVGKMLTDDIDTVLHLKEQLSHRIIGQNEALDTICRRIQTYRADLDDPGKPVGVFLLAGPSGIGKTETALALADILYGGDRNLVSINMSEYQEAYTVSGLKGSPPGYVGYGSGGVLTEAVRQNPYSVVLLDEVEKAHPDVMELFYQVFDKGVLEDAEGLSVDFKNTLILLTTNAGGNRLMLACRESDEPLGAQNLAELLRPVLLKIFKPALLGRLVVVPYLPLSDGVIRRIVELKLEKIKIRFHRNHHITLTYSGGLVAEIAARCREVDTGARNVDHILTHTLLPALSTELLRRMAAGEPCTGIDVGLTEEGNFSYRFEPLPPALPAQGTAAEEDSKAAAVLAPPANEVAADQRSPDSSSAPVRAKPPTPGRLSPEAKRAAKKTRRLKDLFKH